MQRVRVPLFIAVFTSTMLLAAISSSPAATGKALFAKKCLSCHNQSGEAPVITPAKYASIQWERFFNKQKHAKKFKDISGQVSEPESAQVLDFLIKHAADSDKPEA